MSVGTEQGQPRSSFEQLLEFAPDAIVGIDGDGRVVLANHQTEVLFGYARDELIGEPVERLVPERFHAQHPGHRARYFDDPRTRPMGAKLALFARRRDGSEFPAEISLSAIETAQGTVAIAAVRDVTERRAAEGERARLAAIVDSSADAIIGHTASGSITSWNRAAHRLYGYAAEEVVGRDISIITGRQAGTSPRANGDGAEQHEAVHVRKDGTPIDVAVTVSAVRDGRDELLGLATIARDMSRQKRAERTFEDLLEFAPDAIVGVRRDGVIALANRQAEALFGYTRDELLGQPVEMLVPVHLAAGHVGRREEYFGDPRTRPMGAGVELFGRRKDGSGFPAEISLSSLETDEGPVAVAAVRDISDRAESERERALQEELNQTRRLESVGQLAGGIAHDFNNLLGVIINYAKFVADELPDGSQAREDVEEIRAAAKRGAALTRQLLIFSRREVVKREVLDLNALIAALENLLRRALGERVALEVILAEDLRTIEADRGQIEQVLVNLAVNGRDAMPRGGKLVIETRNAVLGEDYVRAHAHLAAGDYVRLTVSDSGVGMDADVARRAFEPFFTTKPKGEGTGLGLATVYGIVTDAGGHISLYSEPDIGTSVKIHLPPSSALVGLPTAPATATPAGRGETVLVVEDEADVRRMSERILTRAGYRVLAAVDVDDALRLIAVADVDLMLTDVVMPGMTGPELVDQIRGTRPDMKVIFMSGYSHRVLAHERLDRDTRSAFIEKPFTREELQRAVRKLLDAAPHA
jgi:two-component system cell cycle sensor histidine kinase/response regulator CckA